MTIATAEVIFIQTLDEYGIDQKNILTKKINRNKTDSLTHSFEINLPADIVLSTFIMDLNKKILSSNGKILSYEKQKGYDLVLKIFSGNILKLQAFFKRKNALKRPSSEIALIVKSIDDLKEEEANSILHHEYPLSIMISPSLKNLEFSELILSQGKEFVVLIGDEIIDDKFNLTDNHDKVTLGKSIGSIISSFKEAEFFILDYNSQLSKSAAFNFIKSEFERNQVKLFPLADLTELKAESAEEIISMFDFYLENLKPGDNKFYLLSAELLPAIQKRLQAFVKKGNKILYPSVLIKNNKISSTSSN